MSSVLYRFKEEEIKKKQIKQIVVQLHRMDIQWDENELFAMIDRMKIQMEALDFVGTVHTMGDICVRLIVGEYEQDGDDEQRHDWLHGIISNVPNVNSCGFVYAMGIRHASDMAFHNTAKDFEQFERLISWKKTSMDTHISSLVSTINDAFYSEKNEISVQQACETVITQMELASDTDTQRAAAGLRSLQGVLDTPALWEFCLVNAFAALNLGRVKFHIPQLLRSAYTDVPGDMLRDLEDVTKSIRDLMIEDDDESPH